MSRILPPAAGARVFAALAAGYVMSYALRSVNAAIAPELVADLGLSHAALGALTSAYFFAFAALQLPLGIWLDRYGSRRTDGILLMVAALGCAIFAVADSFAMLWIGRALIGAGVAGALMASVRVYRFWFRLQLQQSLMAWMLVAGSFGALAATVPVRLALPLVGWRGVFMIAAALLMLAAIGILRLLPRDEPTVPKRSGDESIWRGYLVVFGDPYFWRFGVIALFAQSAFIAFQSLWTGPWFTEVLGMSPDAAAQALLVFNIMLMLGFLGIGWALPRLATVGWDTPRLVVIATVIVVALHLAIPFADGLLGVGLWVAYAVVATIYVPAQSHVSLAFPEALTGRAFTAFNLLIFVGVFVVQWLFGVIVDLASAGAAADAQGFRRALFIWALLEAAALAVFVLWRASPRAADQVSGRGA
ncbi:MAG: MFS transporter [Gemmatimonadales bacterium]|jgi:predicted MFS family arabinose efflux permease|nr:MFS transporter [Gemmatimonadales bacterium]